MSIVFLDTVGLIAQWDKSDQWHPAANQALQSLMARGDRTVTTTFVLLECGNAASRRPYRDQVAQTRAVLESSGQLIVPTDEDWQAAWSAYASGPIGSASIVDHVSFVVMRRLGISDVFTNDRHFRSAGFSALF